MSGKLTLRTFVMTIGVIAVTACQHVQEEKTNNQLNTVADSSNTVSIPYEKYTLRKRTYRHSPRRPFLIHWFMLTLPITLALREKR